ncbi:helix-turn-helix transcriptional regulator [Pseudomonas sp. FP1911]|uniref:helix-turn-helix domain-containing protein n=1 Tax=unclassified Pseudomonas TaxID=196821 RepID=UPI000357245E|nr:MULTISPECIES: helix-turn-helix transcriptional regulator [unclassified Pseudomonas]EPL07397.1 Cro/CI family transcriptional regulator [Pseudomonas sp. CF150]WLG81042.1 helix-turn-helix transcriptional regulator [Pseudomonas sp. FP1911]
MTMGERLKEERQRIGANQTVLAEKCGVTKNTQLAYEKGDRNPDTAYLAAAAGVGVDVLYVITGQRLPVPEGALSGEEMEMVEHVRALDDEDKGAVKRLLRAFNHK